MTVQENEVKTMANSLNDFHAKNWDRMVAEQAFGPPHGLMALGVCCQEELGELAAAILGYTGEKRRKAHLKAPDVLDAVADLMTYLSLVARSVGCTDLEKLLGDTFNMVSDRANSKIKTGLGQPEQATAPLNCSQCGLEHCLCHPDDAD